MKHGQPVKVYVSKPTSPCSFMDAYRVEESALSLRLRHMVNEYKFSISLFNWLSDNKMLIVTEESYQMDAELVVY